VKARPIMMGARSVRNLLAGKKTQTRRIVKPPAPADAKDAGVIGSDSASNGLWFWLDSTDILDAGSLGDEFRCPYGVPGDLLWVREKFCRAADLENDEARHWWGCDKHRHCAYAADDEVAAMEEFHPPWTSSMRMPRSLSRLTLRVTNVLVERVQSITKDDILAEGVRIPVAADHGGVLIALSGKNAPAKWLTADQVKSGDVVAMLRAHWASLWDDVNGTGAWERNDWVWKVSFEVLHCNVDAVTRRAPADVVT
jgi:hypothetical protein